MRTVSLDDKYTLHSGRVLISGRQALVRLPIVQRRLDRKRGWNTAGFISGYRGSPLGAYDSELWKALAFLKEHDIVFAPGLNEDLAATAVWGTQQVGFLPGRKVDGVFALWYGKGPGVDRSGDPFKHANLQGTEPRGGVLLVFGDDHSGKSSSTAHQSDLALAAHDIPVLYPACVSEVLEYGLAGIALSRFSGLIVGLKLVNETADATAIVTLDDARCQFDEPAIDSPPDGVHIRKEFLALLEQDARLWRHKLPRGAKFVRANRLDRITYGAQKPRFVVITAGKAYADVIGALELLGIHEIAAQQIGLAVYKVAMIYPLEADGLREVAANAEEILFVEEKRPHMERQAASVLINLQRRLRVSGKTDPTGGDLLPADVPLDAVTVARALDQRLKATFPHLPTFAQRLSELNARAGRSIPRSPASAKRRPAFCAGCPHSTSTAVPTGSFGMTGIGCHAMAMFMGDRNPLPVTHMGGEGASWLGMAHFTSTPHVFQNLGDGTYNHSGSLAIRAAVQAGATITYKILYNDAVAMTGGQPVEGGRTVGQIAAQVLAEGVKRVIVVSELPERFQGETELPEAVDIYHRDRLDEIQRVLRETVGVTVLIYDQVCAAEKRRRRKRGQSAPPDRRVFINHLVCEGCGDCSVQSQCLAVQPLETDLGRKRKIDQFACNQDLSCTKGFCPSFVTVEGARVRRTGLPESEPLLSALPEPAPPRLDRQFNLLITGIGGTGVVTISSIVGMAAHLEGHGASLYDMTGLSQKGGAVFSHVRLFPEPTRTTPARIAAGEADLILACDVVAATDLDVVKAIEPDRTAVIVNTDVSATASFQSNPDLELEIDSLLVPVRTAAGDREPLRVAASSLSEQLVGDPIATNVLMLGFAWQRGHIPLSRPAIERAIELNQVAVSLNLRAFLVGRALAAFPDQISERAAVMRRADTEPTLDFEAFVAHRTADLSKYHNPRYAERYASLVREAETRESALACGSRAFAWAVARSAFKLMAYKDEYEVARLYTDGRFRANLEQQFEPGYRLKFHLAPPLWSRPDKRTGRPRKTAFGQWIVPFFRLLAQLRRLRETPLDIFGWTEDRRLERRMRDEYLEMVTILCQRLTAVNLDEFVSLAEAPLGVRGFGVVKGPAAAELLNCIRAARARTGHTQCAQAEG
jgi:indolepyruvate ferredoxin oxidoreductase